VLRRLMGAQFPNLTAEQWLGAARRTWHLKHGALKPAYDIGIANALAGIDIERPLSTLLERVRRACRRADAGHSRRQFRHPDRGDGGGCARGAPPWR
jgi:hypothetical protein